MNRKILFITSTTRVRHPILDPSVRYRCYNHAENLAAMGIRADVIAVNLLTISQIDHYDAFVFHRPQYSNKLAAIIEAIDAQRKMRLADYDDLIFGEENAKESSIYKNEVVPEDVCSQIFQDNTTALRLFTTVQTSTPPLAEHVTRHNPSATVHVAPNGLSQRWLKMGEILSPDRTADKVWISYLSGTKSHNHDFSLVADALSQFLQMDKRAMLMIAGPLEYNDNKFPSERIVRVNFRDYWDLPALIQSTDINISPLEPTIFNSCKSGLKFFESGAFGVPTVASPIPDLNRFTHSGLLYAQEKEEWLHALTSLAKYPPDERADLHRYCRQNADSSIGTKKLLKHINSLCDHQ